MDEDLSLRHAELKRGLAARHHDDRIAYTEAKTRFIGEALRAALGQPPRSGWAREEPR